MTPAFLKAMAAAACTALAFIAPAQAQGFPDKPIQLIVPFAAGSVTDVIARAYGVEVARVLGQPVVVENRVGANGMIAAQTVARAKGDGYTLLFGTNSTNAANMSLFKKLPYDQENDFVPVAYLGGLPSIVVVNPALPFKTLAELVAHAKANPGQLNYGAASSSQRIASEMLSTVAGMKMTYVPYKSGQAAVVETISGQIEVFTGDVGITVAHVKSGKLRALAVTSKQRTEMLPELPTVGEALGQEGFEIVAWFGAFAPRGTPAPIVERLNAAFNAAVRTPASRAKLEFVGLQPNAQSPAWAAKFVQAETRKWAKAVADAGIVPE
jgi:tripartite-type tricarboxylate transporter receptor subunit TctC